MNEHPCTVHDKENSKKSLNSGYSEELLNRYMGMRHEHPCTVQESEKEKNCMENAEKVPSNSTRNDINEVIESDFVISPGDIYLNRKVELRANFRSN